LRCPIPAPPLNLNQPRRTKDTGSVYLTLDSKTKSEGFEPIKDFSSLNRSDLNELFQHQHLLTAQQKTMLESVRKKQQLYPKRYRDEDYLRHSALLLLSLGGRSAVRYSLCGVRNSANPSGICRLHKFCPYCSFLEKQKALAKYVPAYESGIWFSIHGSFTGDLTMNSTTDYYDLLEYWDAYKLALRQLVKDKSIRGVFWTEELAVNQMLPVHVLPHIHAIVEADNMDEETITKLKNMVSANLKNRLGPDCLAPNIKIKNLNSPRKLLSHVQYQIKPMKVAKAYDLAWTRASLNNRAQAVLLNSQLTDLVSGYSLVTNRRFKINSAGNLASKAKPYIGTRKKEIKAAKECVREVLEAGVDYIEMEDRETKDSSLSLAFERN